MLANLSKELARAGLPRSELAVRLGISKRALDDKIREKSDFSLGQMLIIKNALPGQGMDYLFESKSAPGKGADGHE